MPRFLFVLCGLIWFCGGVCWIWQYLCCSWQTTFCHIFIKQLLHMAISVHFIYDVSSIPSFPHYFNQVDGYQKIFIFLFILFFPHWLFDIPMPLVHMPLSELQGYVYFNIPLLDLWTYTQQHIAKIINYN